MGETLMQRRRVWEDGPLDCKPQMCIRDSLINKSPDEMMKVRNLGKKSLEEVISKLEALGVNLHKDEE